MAKLGERYVKDTQVAGATYGLGGDIELSVDDDPTTASTTVTTQYCITFTLNATTDWKGTTIFEGSTSGAGYQSWDGGTYTLFFDIRYKDFETHTFGITIPVTVHVKIAGVIPSYGPPVYIPTFDSIDPVKHIMGYRIRSYDAS